MRLALPSFRLVAATLLVTCSGPALGQLCQTGSQSFGGSATEWFTAYQPGPAGSTYLTGGKAGGDVDILALRYDSAGALVWGRTFGSAADEEQEGAHVDASATGGVYITGIISAGGFANDAVLVKYAHDGTLRFARSWDSGAGADDQTGSAAQDAAGNLYLGGNSRGQGSDFDVLFLRFAPTPGATLPTAPFARTWGSGVSDEAINNFVIDDSSGTEFIVAAGSIDSFTPAQQDVLIQKYDLNLNPVWSVGYGANGQDDSYGMAVDPVTGDVYVTGVTHLGVASGEDVILLKYSSGGSFQWGRAWGGSGDESAWNISLDGAGGLSLGGETTSFGAGSSDGLLLKFSSAGELLWSMTWGGSGSGESLGLEHAVSPAGAVRAYGVSNSATDALTPCTGVLTVLSSSEEWTPTGSTGTLAGTLSNLAGSSASYSPTGGGGYDIQLLDFDRGCYPTYCTAGTSASGCQATIASSGIPSASTASGFVLSASSVEGQKDGLFFYGTNGRQANAWGTGTSFQCVTPPVKRAGILNGVGTNGACDGAFAQDLNARWCPACPKPNHNPGAGAAVQAQLWYRDPANTSNQTTSLSDAIEFFVAP